MKKKPKSITFDVTQIIPLDLDGDIIPYQVGHTLGNIIYMKATDLEWDMISRRIYKGEKVQLTNQQIAIIRAFILRSELRMFLPLRNAITKYCDTLIKQKNEKDSNNLT